MLRIQNIRKSFGGVEAIRGSQFEVAPHETLALIGPNGAGKTTLFDIISGFLPADAGEIFWKDANIAGWEASRIARAGISRTFQHVRLFRYLSILDHLRMVEAGAGDSWWKSFFETQRIDPRPYEERIRAFGIEREVSAQAHELSYGQRKLLDLFLAVSRPHELLMFDEPVAGVNAVVQARIEAMLKKLKEQGETMILIDHDMEFISRLADRVIVLDAGVVIAEGKPRDVLKDPKVLEAYLGV